MSNHGKCNTRACNLTSVDKSGSARMKLLSKRRCVSAVNVGSCAGTAVSKLFCNDKIDSFASCPKQIDKSLMRLVSALKKFNWVRLPIAHGSAPLMAFRFSDTCCSIVNAPMDADSGPTMPALVSDMLTMCPSTHQTPYARSRHGSYAAYAVSNRSHGCAPKNVHGRVPFAVILRYSDAMACFSAATIGPVPSSDMVTVVLGFEMSCAEVHEKQRPLSRWEEEC